MQTYDFANILLQRDDLVFEAFVELALMLDRTRLDLQRLEYLPRLSAAHVCLQLHNAAAHLLVAQALKPAAHMRLNDGGLYILHFEATI